MLNQTAFLAAKARSPFRPPQETLSHRTPRAADEGRGDRRVPGHKWRRRRVDIYKHIRVYYGNMAISLSCLLACFRPISDGLRGSGLRYARLIRMIAHEDCCENFAG